MAPKKEKVQKEWAHPEAGTAIDSVEIGSVVDGVVTNVGRFGVFVDFGAKKDGLLKIPVKQGRLFRRGDEIRNMEVLSVDTETEKVQLSQGDGPPQDREAPPQAGRAKADAKKSAKGRGRGGSGRSQSAPPAGSSEERTGGAKKQKDKENKENKEWGHPDATSLDQLHVGQVLDGVVSNVNRAVGVFVDIGYARDGLLLVPKKLRKEFRKGDEVQGVIVKEVDHEAGRLTLEMDSPELVVDGQEATAQPKGRNNRRARSADAATRSSGKKTPKIADDSVEKRELTGLSPGDSIEGVVTNVGQFGVFVNIGCGKDARLNVSKKVGRGFRRGDKLTGLEVNAVDVENKRISLDVGEDEQKQREKNAVGRQRSSSQPPARSKSPAAKPKASPPVKSNSAYVKMYETAMSEVKVEPYPQTMVKKELFKHLLALADRDDVQAVVAGAFASSTIGGPVKGGGKQGRSGARSASPKARNRNASPKQKASAKRATTPSKKSKAAKGPAEDGEPKPKKEKDWGHPDALELSELEEKSMTAGVVTNVTPFGVFLDIGAVKDGLLPCPRSVGRKYKKGQEVKDLKIESVDVENGKIVLRLEGVNDNMDAAGEEEGPAGRSRARGGRGRSRGSS